MAIYFPHTRLTNRCYILIRASFRSSSTTSNINLQAGIKSGHIIFLVKLVKSLHFDLLVSLILQMRVYFEVVEYPQILLDNL